MTQSAGGFELRGDDGDETRMLVHPARGYAIAVVGRPRIVAPTAAVPRYDIVLALGDAPVELGFRMDEVPTAIAPDDLVPALALAYARSRAAAPDELSPNALRGRVLAPGADAGAAANYRLHGDDARAMEFLAIAALGGQGVVHALHLTARYRRGDFTPFDWMNLRAALLTHQSWQPGTLPDPVVWPASAFALPSATLTLSPAAIDEANAKAADVGTVAPDDVERIADLLLSMASGDEAPAIPMHSFVHDMTSRRVAAAVPRIAEVLLRNIGQVQSVHDLRAWCWQCYWAVGNRAELRRLN